MTLADFFESHLGRLEDGARDLLGAARALVRMCETFDSCGWVMGAPSMQVAVDAWKEHCALTSHIGSLFSPKRHVIVHMLQGVLWFGNPRFYANWEDESLNKTLKKACRLVSQVTFEPGLLLRMPEVMRLNKQRTHEERAAREG